MVFFKKDIPKPMNDEAQHVELQESSSASVARDKYEIEQDEWGTNNLT